MKRFPHKLYLLIFIMSGCSGLLLQPQNPTAEKAIAEEIFSTTKEITPTPIKAMTFIATPTSISFLDPVSIDDLRVSEDLPKESNIENKSIYMLTTEQQKRLRRIAMNFIAPTQEEATSVAQELGYVQHASPSNMCGPLTLAILRDAGIIESNVNLKDFWLIRPNQKPEVIERILPPERYNHFYFNTPINQFDFNIFPLVPGDILYLYAGSWGTFEHILVITRIDMSGRAFSVTNLNTAKDGNYVIQEVMLYDPQQPGVGQFYEWTNRDNMWIGLTGFGGFDVWRLSKQLEDLSDGKKKLSSDTD